MQLVLWFQLRKLQVIVACLIQLSRLHIAMRQQFVNFGDVGGVARLLQQFEQCFKSCRIFAYVPNGRMQAFQDFGGIPCQQSVRMLPVELQHFLEAPGGNQGIRVFCHGDRIVMYVQQLGRQVASFRKAATLNVSSHQGTQPLGMRIEVCNFFQILDCGRDIAGIQRAAPAQQ